MIAGLTMYDRPETAGANDRFWALIVQSLADQGIHAPRELSRDVDEWTLWLDPNLVFAQTCGLPYRWRLHGKVKLIGTPYYEIHGEPGHYHSALVVHNDDARTLTDLNGSRLAVNDGRSQSGWAAPLDFAGRNKIAFGSVALSGGHINSARMVANKQADIAAIDAVTWTLIQRYDPFAQDLRVLATTPSTPTLPFITALGQDSDALFDAVSEAIDQLSREDRRTLCLNGIVKISAEDYLAVTTPEPPSADLLQ